MPTGYPTVGMIGGGQLARMTHQAAIALGVGFRVLAGGPTDSAAQVVADIHYGAHDDPDAVVRFAAGCDVVTFDHEHVPQEILHRLTAQGIAVRPSPAALRHAQDKIDMRAALTAAGIPCPAWGVPTGVAEVADFADRHGWPVVLKTSRGGYDGRGVWVVPDRDAAAQVLATPLTAPGARWLMEQHVDFVAEVSAQVARSPHGQAVAYPVVRTVQRDGMCNTVIAPDPDLPADLAVRATHIALRVAEVLDVTGMLAVEMFRTADDIVVNELAMRPHNSGHWSIDGAVTSQFENHLRAVLDLPLGDPRPTAPVTVMVNVLGGDEPDLYEAYKHVQARDPGIRVHMYGKDVRPGRKHGHVTVCGPDPAELLDRAAHAAAYITGTIEE